MANYYVDYTNGLDTNPGTLASPWKTLTYAEDVAVGGDTVYARGGTWPNCHVTHGASGTSSAHIVFEAYPGETPVLDGGWGSTAIVNFNGKAYIEWNGFTLRNNSYNAFYNNAAGSTGVQIKNCTIYNIGWDTGWRMSTASETVYNGVFGRSGHSNWLIENCVIHHCASRGVLFWDTNSSGNIVRRCDIYHPGIDCIYIGGSGVIIEYCELHNNNNPVEADEHADGIQFYISSGYGTNLIVRHNLIYSIKTNGIMIEKTDSIQVYGNVIADLNTGQNDTGGGAINFHANSNIGTKLIFNNTVVGFGLGMDSDGIVIFRNNVSCAVPGASSSMTAATNFDSTTNKHYSSVSAAGFYDASSYEAIKGGGLRPKDASSPLVDAGANTSDITLPATDIIGNARIIDGDNNGIATVDIGAYEYNPTGQPEPPEPHVPTQYYVKVEGSDSNDGKTIATAFATPHKAAQVMLAGDTCDILVGTYNFSTTMTLAAGGESEDKRITFRKYSSDVVTFRKTAQCKAVLINKPYITLQDINFVNTVNETDVYNCFVHANSGANYVKLKNLTGTSVGYNTYGFQVNAVSGGRITGALVENVSVNNMGTASGAVFNTALRMRYCDNFTVKTLSVSTVYGMGLILNDCDGGSVEDVWLHDIRGIEDTWHNCYALELDYVRNTTLKRIGVQRPSTTGLVVPCVFIDDDQGANSNIRFENFHFWTNENVPAVRLRSATDVKFYNGVLAAPSIGIENAYGGSNCTIKNTLFWGCASSGAVFNGSNNFFYNASIPSWSLSSYSGEPVLVSPSLEATTRASWDILDNTSPLINKGATISVDPLVPTVDYLNKTRDVLIDIGPFEWQEAAPPSEEPPPPPPPPSDVQTIIKQPLLKDTWLSQSAPNTNYGSDTKIRVNATTGQIVRGLMADDISNIPKGSTIWSAKLELYSYQSSGDVVDTVEIVKCNITNWVEGETTWNVYKTGEAWGTAGGDFVLANPAKAVSSFNLSMFGFKAFDITAIVQDAIDNEAGILSVIIKMENEGSDNWVDFYSREGSSSNTSLRPKLTIIYRPPAQEETTTPPTAPVIYTPTKAQKEAAFRGTGGVRRLKFRYELLDKNNAYKRQLLQVERASIEYNRFRDIHRTARITMVDDGSIDFLNDRIKPYVSVYVPPTANLMPDFSYWSLSGGASVDAEGNLVLSGETPLTGTDFSEYTTDTIPSDWTSRWGSYSFLVKEKTGTLGGKCLEADGIGTADGLLTWNKLEESADTEALLKIRTDTNTDSQGGAAVRCSGTSSSKNGYVAHLKELTGFYHLRIGRWVNNASGTISTASYAWTNNTWYWIRFRVSGTSPNIHLKAKVWADGENEPSAWTLEATDSNISTAGWTGIIANHTTSVKDIDYFSAGLNGATAPSPGGGEAYADSPLIPVNYMKQFTFSAEHFASAAAPVGSANPTGTKATRLVYVYYYDKNFQAVKNAKDEYSKSSLEAFNSPGSWSGRDAYWQYDLGPNIYYIKIRIKVDTAYTGPSYKTRKIMVTVNSVWGQFVEFSGYGGFADTPMGVFLLSTTSRREEGGLVIRQVEAYDQLQVLLDDKVTDRYTVASGTNYITAIKTLLEDAGIVDHVLTYSSLTLPAAKDYPLGTPKLQIINELLSAINYMGLYFNEQGQAVAEPYISPEDRGTEWEYADDEISVTYPDMIHTYDLFKVPNKWVGVVSESDRTVLTSTYINSNAASPTSTVSRGRTIVGEPISMDAANQTTLDAKVARQAFEDSQVYEYIEFTTAIMPYHKHANVYRIKDSTLLIDNKYSESEWGFEMVAGAKMTHKARRVVPV